METCVLSGRFAPTARRLPGRALPALTTTRRGRKSASLARRGTTA